MLPIFLREFFVAVSPLQFPMSNREKCCPFFRDNFLQHFDLAVFLLMTGKILLMTGGNAAHLSARSFGSVFISQFLC